MKFKVGDRIRVIQNSLTGTIMSVDTLVNINGTQTEYSVQWDHWQTTGLYMTSAVDDLWEKIQETIKSPFVIHASDHALDALSYSLASGLNKQIAENLTKNYIPQDGDELLPCDTDPLNSSKAKKECDHKWVNVSFLFEKMACYHCGADKS